MKKLVSAITFAALAVPSFTGCSSAPTEAASAESSDLAIPVAACWTRDSTVWASRASDGADICDSSRFADLSELPAPLANAGCTSMGSYQLGYLSKSARYAICPIVNGVCPTAFHSVVPCNPSTQGFAATYQWPDDSGSAPYGYATRGFKPGCDACMPTPPSGYEYVLWHERTWCLSDSEAHDAAIKSDLQTLGYPIPAHGSGNSSVCGPQTGCPGGCMVAGRPNGI